MEKLTEITIIGFGNQAKAWAMNLRDSGINVYIGLRSNSQSVIHAQNLNFTTFSYESDTIPSKFFALLIPDESHFEALDKMKVEHNKHVCIYAHGFSNIKFKLSQKFPYIKHLLLAPKSIASEVRFLYETNKNISAIFSNEFCSDLTQNDIQEVASHIGFKNIYYSTFEQETHADLFSEQSILCSLIPYGALLAYNTLRENNYPKELAFFECFYEIKLIADTLLKVGPEKFFDLISPNALIGSQLGKDLLLDDNFQ